MRESIGKTNGRYNTKNNTYGYNEKRRHIVRPNSILYHCNDKTRCQKFLDNKKFMIESKEDGIWLGNGMYFWDNLSNAKFWYRKKQQKHDELLIVQSNVYTDFLLDLTDLDVCNKMEQLWNKVYKENEIKIPKDKITLGVKLNYLYDYYDYYDMFKDVYQVIKVIGKYKKTPQNSFYKYDLDSRRAEPTTAIKCIYNVKNVDAIATREKV